MEKESGQKSDLIAPKRAFLLFSSLLGCVVLATLLSYGWAKKAGQPSPASESVIACVSSTPNKLLQPNLDEKWPKITRAGANLPNVG